MNVLIRYPYCLDTQCPLGLDTGSANMAYKRQDLELRPERGDLLPGICLAAPQSAARGEGVQILADLRAISGLGQLAPAASACHDATPPVDAPITCAERPLASAAGSLSPEERHLLWWLTEGRGR